MSRRLGDEYTQQQQPTGAEVTRQYVPSVTQIVTGYQPKLSVTRLTPSMITQIPAMIRRPQAPAQVQVPYAPVGYSRQFFTDLKRPLVQKLSTPAFPPVAGAPMRWTGDEISELKEIMSEVKNMDVCWQCTEAAYQVEKKIQSLNPQALVWKLWRWPDTMGGFSGRSSVVVYPRRTNNPESDGIILDTWAWGPLDWALATKRIKSKSSRPGGYPYHSDYDVGREKVARGEKLSERPERREARLALADAKKIFDSPALLSEKAKVLDDALSQAEKNDDAYAMRSLEAMQNTLGWRAREYTESITGQAKDDIKPAEERIAAMNELLNEVGKYAGTKSANQREVRNAARSYEAGLRAMIKDESLPLLDRSKALAAAINKASAISKTRESHLDFVSQREIQDGIATALNSVKKEVEQLGRLTVRIALSSSSLEEQKGLLKTIAAKLRETEPLADVADFGRTRNAVIEQWAKATHAVREHESELAGKMLAPSVTDPFRYMKGVRGYC